MKLHHLSVHNLNSLYGTQEVDFDRHLAEAPLFVIVGPTGSGKSTLMDAISLALFGRTPRLSAKARDRDTDPRRVMSRGTGNARASLTFSKIEEGTRVTYRAIWSCSRARRKADGRFQDPDRSLERLTPEGSWELLVSDRRKKFYQPVFQEVLEGFSVEDFQRSMLLAQGHFDAFLSAGSQERAAILERLTDTSRYQELGARASKVASIYRRKIGEIEQVLKRRDLPDPSEEQAVREELKKQTEITSTLEQQMSHVEAAQRWHQTQSQLMDESSHAQRRLTEAQSELEQHRSRIDGLDRHEQCEDGFALLDILTRLQQRRDELLVTQARQAEELPKTEQALNTTQKTSDTLKRQAKEAAQFLTDLRPLTERCGTLRRQLAEQNRLRDQTTSTLDTAKARLSRAQGHRADGRAELDTLQRDHRALEELLQADPLHGHRQRLLDLLTPLHSQLTSLSDQLQAKEAHLRRERSQGAKRAKAFIDHKEQLASLQSQELAEARTHLGDHRKTHGPDEALAMQVEAQRQQETQLLEQRHLVEQAKHATETAQKTSEELQRTQARLAQVSERLRHTREQVEHQEKSLTLANAQEELAKAAVSTQQDLMGLLQYRDLVHVGEDCPLCGSTVAKPPSLKATEEEMSLILARQKEALHAAVQQVHSLQKSHTASVTTLAKDTSEQGHLSERVQEAQQRISDLLEDNAKYLRAAQMPPHTSVDQATTLLNAREHALQSSSEALKQALQERERLRTHLAEVEAEVERITASLATADALNTEAKAQIQHLEEELAHLVQTQTECHQKVSHLLSSHQLPVAPPLDETLDALQVARDREHTHTQRHIQLSEKIQSLLARDEELQRDITREQGAVETARITHDRAISAQRETEAQYQASRHQLRNTWSQGQAAGMSPPADPTEPISSPQHMTTHQELFVQELQEKSRQWVEKKGSLEGRLTALKRSITETEDQLLSSEAQHKEAVGALNGALETLKLPNQLALIAARLDGEALKEARSIKATVLRALHTSQESLTTAQRALQAHHSQRPDLDMQAEELEGAALELRERVETSKRANQTLGSRLMSFESLKKTHASDLEALQQLREESSIWTTLHSLIGTREGAAFKEFAQALNLGELLKLSNEHLSHLSPRYTLVPKLDEDSGLPTLDFLVEDRWQAGAQRSTKTLSGGERFLISLGLALGLSEMRSVSMPLETLLLDEGFGTLDRGNLDIAVAALQQLQAKGRQVGVISHVESLHERIDAQIRVIPQGSGRSILSCEPIS